jgi:spore coat protein CotF
MQQQQPKPEFTIEGGHVVMFHREPTGLPKVKDSNVNDRDRMQDLLAQEKYMATGYNNGMIEASHDGLFQVLKQNQENCHKLQRQLFDTMFKKGWYKLPVADAQSVAYSYNQFEQYQTQFPFPWQVGQASKQAASHLMQMGAQSKQQTAQQSSVGH